MQINNVLPDWLKARGITKLLAFDFETFYSVSYTLKKMSTTLYILDEQFKVHGVGVTYDNQPTKYLYTPIDIAEFFADIDWKHTAILAHHTHFDGLILARHYGYTPAFYLDTLSMARPILMNTIKSLDIDTIAKFFNVGGKTKGLDNTKGKRELTDQEQQDLGNYCINDVHMMIDIFILLLPHFPQFEMEIIDWHIRMYVEGEFIIDKALAKQESINIQKRKKAIFHTIRNSFQPELRDSDLDTLTILRSADKFASVLQYNNITPPLKISKTTGKQAYAFAKSDIDFMAFATKSITHKLLFEARVESKSDTAINKVKLLDTFGNHPPMPLYLNYWKATTGRTTGGDKIQVQNFTRGGNARKCLTALKNNLILSVDSSGIELRISIWFANQIDKILMVNNKEDLYVDMATHIYHVTPDMIDKYMRGIGKVAILSNQYGSGIPTFDNMLKAGSMAPPIHLPYEEVTHIHRTFRKEYDAVVRMWDKCQHFLYAMAHNNIHTEKDYKGLKFEAGKVWTQHGMYLNYHDLRVDKQGNFSYQGAYGVRKKIYGALLYNNLCGLEGTLVLTPRGWIEIQHITNNDQVHDGTGFVNHEGLVYNGVKECIPIDGTYFTPDHEILNEKQEWQTALENPRPYRPDLWDVNCNNMGTFKQSQTFLGMSMPMRNKIATYIQRIKTSKITKLWLSNKTNATRKSIKTRNVWTSSIQRIRKYACTLFESKQSSLEQLWRTRNSNKQTMVNRIRNFLDRYEGYIQKRFNLRTLRQQRSLFQRELLLENNAGTTIQSSFKPLYKHTEGTYDNSTSGENISYKSYNFISTPFSKLAYRKTFPISQTGKVYDIMNCGPLNRFVVKGDNGPFIVHNCQHMARNVVYSQINLVKEKYTPIHVVHDETSIIIDENDFDEAKEFLLKCFRTAPSYLTGINLDAEVEWGKNAKGISYYAK